MKQPSTRRAFLTTLASAGPAASIPISAATAQAPLSTSIESRPGSAVTLALDGLSAAADITRFLTAVLNEHPEGVVIEIPPGDWTVRFQAIVIRSNTHIRSAIPGTVKIRGFVGGPASRDADPWALFTVETGARNISITDLEFDGPNPLYRVLTVRQKVRGVRARNLNCGRIACLHTSMAGFKQEELDDEVRTKGVDISSCTGFGSLEYTANTRAQFIVLYYTDQWQVRDCVASGYHSGVQWWGGDASPKSAGADFVSGTRRCRNGLVENCRFSDVGAAVWGGLGTNIVVRDCFAERVGDVAFDAEGCFDVTFENCHGIDAKAAIFSIFYAAIDIRFLNCTGEFRDTAEYNQGGQSWFFRSWNSSRNPHVQSGIVLDGCLFKTKTVCPNGRFPTVSDFGQKTPGGFDGGAMFDPVIRNCRLKNGTINLSYDQNQAVSIVDNRLDFTISASEAFSAIRAGTLVYGLRDGEGWYSCDISRNKVHYLAPQPDKSVCIQFQTPKTDIPFKLAIKLFDNEIIGRAATTHAIQIINGFSHPSAALVVNAGGNIVPSAYLDNGSPLDLDDRTARNPTEWITYGRNKEALTGKEFGGIGRTEFGPISIAPREWLEPTHLAIGSYDGNPPDRPTSAYGLKGSGFFARAGTSYRVSYSVPSFLIWHCNCPMNGILTITAYNPTDEKIELERGVLTFSTA